MDTPKGAIVSPSNEPKDTGARQEEHKRCVTTSEETNATEEKEPLAVVQGTADIINASGDSSSPFATEDLDIVDELSAFSMTEDDHQQFLEELENLLYGEEEGRDMDL